MGARAARVLARRGLRRGLQSPAFPIADLLHAASTVPLENVYVEVSGSGQLAARGGVARAAAVGRLAPAPPLAAALLSLAAPGALRVRLVADVAPLQELLFWFDEHTLALLDMPFMTLRNITGLGTYRCHVCGTEFEFPNPLKVHLLLGCTPASPAALWARLAAAAAGAAAVIDAGARAGTRAGGSFELAMGLGLPVASGQGAGARLEALAATAGAGVGAGRGHACVFCGKLYSRRYGLKIHIRTHTGYKPLRCRHCLRAFGDPSNLNKHVRLHQTPGRDPPRLPLH